MLEGVFQGAGWVVGYVFVARASLEFIGLVGMEMFIGLECSARVLCVSVVSPALDRKVRTTVN